MTIPLKLESNVMIQWTLPLDNVVRSMRSLYHDDTFQIRIERHDSMVPSLRQRRLILEPLYHGKLPCLFFIKVDLI